MASIKLSTTARPARALVSAACCASLALLLACGGSSSSGIQCRFDAECASGEICIGVPQLPVGTCGHFSFPDASTPARDGGRVEADDGGVVAEDGGLALDGGAAIDGGTASDGGVVTADAGVHRDGGGMVLDGGRGERCDSATVISAGTYFDQTTVGYTHDFAGGAGCTGTAGAERIYAVAVPNGRKLSALVAPTTDGFDPSLNLVLGPSSNCGANATCIDSDDSGNTAATNVVEWSNHTGTERTVFVIVDTFALETRGTFTLEVELADAPASPPPGDTCALAAMLTPGTVTSTTAGLTNDYGMGTSCSSSAGPDGVYKIVVASGKELTASVRGTGAFDPSIAIGLESGACATTNRTCFAGADNGSAMDPNTVRYTNTGGGPQTLYVFIDTSTAGQTGPFELTTSIVDAPQGGQGDTCATAPSIGATMVNGTTIGYTNDFTPGTGCAGAAGADRMYSISVPGNTMLTATVTPTGTSWDPSLSLVRGPLPTACTGVHTCVASADTGDLNQPDTVRYTNSSGSPETIFIVVDSFYAEQSGTFTLRTMYSQP